MNFKKEKKKDSFSSLPYSRFDVPWVSDILIPFMIAILYSRVIASKYVWVCFWELKTVNVLILDANSVVHLGPSYSTLPAVSLAEPRGQDGSAH